jgi:cysteine synthase B
MSLHTNRRACSVVDLVGNTPLVRLRSVEARAGTGAEVWAKAEWDNPGGSVKDRAAKQIITDALAAGKLGGGRTLIDSTSGNTGVAYSMIGAALGVPIALVMPANVSVARKNITQAYGTHLIYSSELEGSDGAIRKVQEVVAAEPDRWYYPDQYANPSNWRAHYLGTGTEILEQTAGKVTHFVAGVGTTGTVMGTGRRLKEHAQAIRVIAVQPDDAWHGLEGMKHLPSSIVPPIWQPDGVVDEMMEMATDEAWAVSEQLIKDEGLFVGHSAGCNVAAALRIAKTARAGDLIVTVLCDRGDRYFAPQKWEKVYVW